MAPRPSRASYLLASLIGGLVVALVFLGFGWARGGGTETVLASPPITGYAIPAAQTGGLSAHAIYVRDAPGVVFVQATVIQQVTDPFDLFPVQQNSISTGSGFLIDRQGYILTNYHVVENMTGIMVKLQSGEQLRGTVVGTVGVNQQQAPAGLGDAAANWQDLGSIGFPITSGTLTAVDGGLTAHLTLLGNYATSNFALSNDGHGGTFVKYV